MMFRLSVTAGRWARRLVILCLVGEISLPALAMKLEVHGSRLYATGTVEVGDAMEFLLAFDNPRIDTVVLAVSPGGNLEEGLTVGQLIRQKSYHTVAAGPCISSCSLMFVGGTVRRFSNALPAEHTFVGIHGASEGRGRTQASLLIQARIYEHFQKMMGTKFQAELMRKALQDMDSAEALLKVPETARQPQTTVFCSAGLHVRQSCKEYPKDTALSLGVITDSALDSVPIPRSLFAPSQYMGLTLSSPIFDLERHLQALQDQYCRTAPCVDAVRADYDGGADHKAIAVSESGASTTGMNLGKDASPQLALLRAIYACNHPKDGDARLCKPLVLDNQDLARTHQTIKDAHVSAQRRLTVPALAAYADEEIDGSGTVGEALRFESFQEVAPIRVPGVTTIATQRLAKLILENRSLLLVDVGKEQQTLPGARWLVNGGAAYADATRDSAVNKRFSQLLSRLAPDKDAPLVFFDQGRGGWLALNAARRAQRLGYAQVYWYRGGLASWSAAQLPTAPQQLQAVAN